MKRFLSSRPKNKRGNETVTGSQSDSSLCDATISAKHQKKISNNNSQQTVTQTVPKLNGYQRESFISMSDKDQSGSSSHEGYVKSNPVMENRVSSTNNDVVYKFSGQCPLEAFEVTYSIEERVRTAAFAIVYNNCKISTDKFETIYDKPAPDFKTIFAWRQKLLTTGCLVENHVENQGLNILREVDPKKVPLRVSNPEEISIDLDSEDELEQNIENNHNTSQGFNRSGSADTLLIDKEQKCQPASGNEKEMLQSRASSRTSQSSSRDSRDSKSSDSDVELVEPEESCNAIIPNNISNPPDSDSDSLSYSSENIDFRSRVFADKKTIEKSKKVPNNKNDALCSNTNSTFQGYTTQKDIDKPLLATGNIYMPSFRNINVRNSVCDNGLSAEYVPTMMAATAKKHYQDFKNNVKKKGYWAKGNGTNFTRNSAPLHEATMNLNQRKSFSSVVSSSRMQTYNKLPSLSKPVKNYTIAELSGTGVKSDHSSNVTVPYYESMLKLPPPRQNHSMPKHLNSAICEDFTKDEIDTSMILDNYVSFATPLGSTTNKQKVLESNSRVFDIVQATSINKNKNIMDIFSSIREESPEKNELQKYDQMRKKYESMWNIDDDDLYKDPEKESNLNQEVSITSESVKIFSPSDSKLLLTKETILKKHDEMLNLLNDLQGNDITDTTHLSTQSISANVISEDMKSEMFCHNITNIPLPDDSNNASKGSLDANESLRNSITLKNISPSKEVHVLESIIIKPKDPIGSAPSENQRNLSQEKDSKVDINEEVTKKIDNQENPTLDLSNILSNIDTDTLILALRNVQQLTQSPNTAATSEENLQESKVDTINLTNDEWEMESVQHESIERELQRLDGNAEDTPFLNDIFNPSPINMPLNIKMNMNCKSVASEDKQINLNENAAVIGNFKSFALPKPLILNRLKLAVKQPDKKKGEGKRMKRKKKVCIDKIILI